MYIRRKSLSVDIGGVALGSAHPIRVQSMTITDSMDTEGTAQQTIELIKAGSDYVRITAPSLKVAKNLAPIKKRVKELGYSVPLIADIHFTPNAAEMAARIVEKVRINPGNYVDKKKFESKNYDKYAYEQELDRIRKQFTPLVKICKEYGTAMRIGTNHGSLSDRIMSYYGDSPLGMVESALEFVRICEDLGYYSIVLSMKASNPKVMIEAYRLLVKSLDKESLKPYPLHLGVTEAGSGLEGRVKSALGIGVLLEEGIGDTIRVSLTESPEKEIPVAKSIIQKVTQQKNTTTSNISNQQISFFKNTNPKKSTSCENIGNGQAPRVLADFSSISNIQPIDLKAIGHHYSEKLDKWNMTEVGADYIYLDKNPLDFMLPNGLCKIVDYSIWCKTSESNSCYPLFHSFRDFQSCISGSKHPSLNFIELNFEDLKSISFDSLSKTTCACFIVNISRVLSFKEYMSYLINFEKKTEPKPPLIIKMDFNNTENTGIASAIDLGSIFIEEMGDGTLFTLPKDADKISKISSLRTYNNLAFTILQASRRRFTKTEYISCPSCGRTLFDLEDTTAKVRKQTEHLKGVKIAVMGCIVNGPGEMADADYGYVGSGRDKITLYRGKEIVKRNVVSKQAVDELIQIIKDDNLWLEPTNILS